MYAGFTRQAENGALQVEVRRLQQIQNPQEACHRTSIYFVAGLLLAKTVMEGGVNRSTRAENGRSEAETEVAAAAAIRGSGRHSDNAVSQSCNSVLCRQKAWLFLRGAAA